VLDLIQVVLAGEILETAIELDSTTCSGIFSGAACAQMLSLYRSTGGFDGAKSVVAGFELDPGLTRIVATVYCGAAQNYHSSLVGPRPLLELYLSYVA
jgi:hypothetical protein